MKVRVGSFDIAYDDHGIGIPIIFLHAFPLNRTMWTGLMIRLLGEQRYRLVAFDWPGFGGSEIGPAVLTMDNMADIVAGLMDALGMQQAVLCGLSMGGYAALAFLRTYPHRLAGLILADTKPAADTDAVKENREKIARRMESEGLGNFSEEQIGHLLAASTREQHPDITLRVKQMIEIATPQGIAAVARGMAQRSDTTDLLAQISCPTLVIVGEQDELTPPQVAQKYATRIADAQFAVIPRAGHLPVLEQPEAFIGVLRTFLQASL